MHWCFRRIPYHCADAIGNQLLTFGLRSPQASTGELEQAF